MADDQCNRAPGPEVPQHSKLTKQAIEHAVTDHNVWIGRIVQWQQCVEVKHEALCTIACVLSEPRSYGSTGQ